MENLDLHTATLGCHLDQIPPDVLTTTALTQRSNSGYTVGRLAV